MPKPWPTRLSIAVLAPVLALTGCGKEESPARRARDDAHAIAMVEAAQHTKPPPVALTPQPITAADLATHRLSGSGCKLFGPEDRAGDPLATLNPQRAMIKVEGRFMILAADVGSTPAVEGVMRHYVGKSHSIRIERSGGDGHALGQDDLRWPARLTIYDAWDQVVFTTAGDLVCGP